MKPLVSICPVCAKTLRIESLRCDECKSRLETDLEIPLIARLPADLLKFALIFLRCRGNIREVEKAFGISYPTVCKKLDLVNQLLDNQDTASRAAAVDRHVILGQLERGEITAREAAKLLKGE